MFEPTEEMKDDELRAEIAKRDDGLIAYAREIVALKAERDAAFVRGLERARRIADKIELTTVDYGIERAIQAEIDKAGK